MYVADARQEMGCPQDAQSKSARSRGNEMPFRGATLTDRDFPRRRAWRVPRENITPFLYRRQLWSCPPCSLLACSLLTTYCIRCYNLRWPLVPARYFHVPFTVSKVMQIAGASCCEAAVIRTEVSIMPSRRPFGCVVCPREAIYRPPRSSLAPRPLPCRPPLRNGSSRGAFSFRSRRPGVCVGLRSRDR